MTDTAPSSPAFGGLTAKQARITLLVVIALTLLGGLAELFADWRTMRGEVRQDMADTLRLVEGSAAEAAFQLNPVVAAGVVDGLMEIAAVERVVLTDNFGTVMREADKDRPPAPSYRLAERLFGDVTAYAQDLRYQRGARLLEVGRLEVHLSADLVSHRFLERAATNGLLGAVRALLISLLIVGIFYWMITRPLVRLAHALAEVDPARPGAREVATPPGHQRDEFGLLVWSLNRLLRAFQEGLSRRDTAEEALRALTRDLEHRVADRTRDLEAAMAALSHEKEETERAFSRLDQVHRDLDKANTLLLESITYARKIQGALLPDEKALGEAVADIAVYWQPLNVVGGDYFWLERLEDGSCLIIVADCTGHGVPGAFMTMVAASALDRALHDQKLRDPVSILEALDDMVRLRLRQDHPESLSDDGLDAAVCLLDPVRRTLTYAGANLPVLLHRPGAADVEEIKGTRASLGYRSLPRRRAFEVHDITLETGTALYLITDGIVDHMGEASRRLLGRRRLKEMILENVDQPMAEQIARLHQKIDDWRGDEPSRDDMTMVALRLK